MPRILAACSGRSNDRALEGVLESKRILLPANRWVEIDRMIHFAAELKQRRFITDFVKGLRIVP